MAPRGYVVSIFVSGMVGIFWIIFFIFSAAGTCWVNTDILKEWSFWVPLFALVYVFGVIIDNGSREILYKRLNKKLAKKYYFDLDIPNAEDNKDKVRRCVYSLYAEIPEVFSRLDYKRNYSCRSY